MSPLGRTNEHSNDSTGDGSWRQREEALSMNCGEESLLEIHRESKMED